MLSAKLLNTYDSAAEHQSESHLKDDPVPYVKDSSQW